MMLSFRIDDKFSIRARFAFTLLFLAACVSQSSADDGNRFARWEKDIAAFERSDKENPPPKNGIVFVGSSSIRLWNLNKSFPGLPVINRGFGGSHLADVVHFVSKLVIKHNPRLVVVYAGENDIAAGAKPDWVAGDFREFVRVLHKELPRTEIIYLSLKPSLARWKLIEQLRTVNRLIEEETKKDKLLHFVDVASPLLGDDGKPRRELFVDDGLHLNEKGYTIWTSMLKPLLEKELSKDAATRLFRRENLVAWCIVPFDAKKRGPEDRAAMLERLGFKHFAYDWRAEHIPSFHAEVEALKKHHIALDAFWFPASLDSDARKILDLLSRHKIKAQLWVTMGDPAPEAKSQAERVEAAARVIRPIAEEAEKIGCKVGLYNHGGWFGEPENQIAVIKSLKLSNVGIVYNLHHGHNQVDRLPELLRLMLPRLYAVNLNGMSRGGEKVGRKILPLGQGELDLRVLKAIYESGYAGPIGILGHTMNDAEDQLRDNLDGLDWLLPQLDGKPAGPSPKPRTPVPQLSNWISPEKTASAVKGLAYDRDLVARLLADAKAHGNAGRGAEIFRSPQFACLTCHKVGNQGGSVGPDLTLVSRCLPADQIVESVLWPRRQIKEGYMAISVVTRTGTVHTGYKQRENDKELVLKDPPTGNLVRLAKVDIEERTEVGTLMPDGLAEAMSTDLRRDLIRFLLELGASGSVAPDKLLAHSTEPATFTYRREPLHPQYFPSWQHHVNRDRLYDFYVKEAEYFNKQAGHLLLPEFPGLDGGKYGHWGNQNEDTWADDRWNKAILGSVMCGVLHAPNIVVPKGVCVRIGDHGEMAVCFNPETLCYEVLWRDGFVKFSSVRHGFMDGLILDGKILPRPEGLGDMDLPTIPGPGQTERRRSPRKPEQPFQYHGFYRHGNRVIFAYRLGNVEMLDSPWVEDGKFRRLVGPASGHLLEKLTKGGPPQWPQLLETHGKLGITEPYAFDTIVPPFDNPWKAPLFFGDFDFLPDGTALICTMQGDVWKVEGLDGDLNHVRWRRFASGLHHCLGLVVSDGQIYVLGRDQITRLHDLNGDGETDFYECFSNSFVTSPAGHDFICGLQRDSAGRFYTVSGNQGLVRISADGRKAEVLATGFRNPDGLALLPDSSITVPCSEGEWTPASMICLVRPNWATGTGRPYRGLPESKVANRPDGAKEVPYYGYPGPKNGRPPELPLVYLPRGLDNSSGGQTFIVGDKWGPLQGQLVHFSYGAATHFLVLRDEVAGQAQGAIVPLPGEFLSGVHRGRFNPKDGQLYVCGMGGWGTYGVADGCFQRVRYTGRPVQLPCGFHVYENGVRISFTLPVDRTVAGDVSSHFAQAWNYRYSSAYGSPEFSPRHFGIPGHDPLTITSAHVLPDGKSIFLEIPDVQPVNQLHLHLHVDSGRAQDVFLTVHRLDAPFTDYPGYQAIPKTIAAHPILTDLAMGAKFVPNPWKRKLPNARPITMEAGKNLSFQTRQFTVHAGENIQLIFSNPDVVPHNWILAKPGSLERVGELANKLVADPEAVSRHYIPRSNDVLFYTDIVSPHESFTIYFRAPLQKGRYPYLCSFPGHWMVMNGQMIVE
jgi:putative heme-binding domain-containing protein